ncbi:hypothetical protein CBM2598_U20117 [Cupriavidus taiwanensis]|uniref:Uncharacterized protein n=1 Tax=Cupriavidus taiwanensis TaxID=164546 RepID=A0A7Z7JJB4_9BURK|nr:hypothetical protein CBM2597_U20106 [Cupriavidus taiwanensis]SOZ96840.1 hypothetical protein CBM2598_U20117 [Cupriavidus taiwanensis]SPC25992.1 hypothetical protein CBM2594_U30014 [Cupriavidus taiwanensis]
MPWLHHPSRALPSKIESLGYLDLRHGATDLRALLTGTCALLAMLRFVLGALRPTLFTDLRAQRAYRARVLAVARHHRRGIGTCFGTVQVECDAAFHGLNLWLTQTRRSTVMTGDCAGVTGFNTR